MVIDGFLVESFEMVKNLILREKKNQNFTIETQFIETDGSVTVLDDGENGKTTFNDNKIDLPDATPQGKIVETLKRRNRNAPIEMWLDIMEKKIVDNQKISETPADYSAIVSKMLQVCRTNFNKFIAFYHN